MEVLKTTERRVALVSHRSSPKILRFQRDLAATLVGAFPGRVFPVRVYASRTGQGDAKETTQRSRSFLYAALGFVVARMFGTDRLRFHENGIVSFNLPISDQVVGSMATRTTHPLSLRLLREFLSLVAEAPVDLANPFVWRTKTEVFETLKTCGFAHLARESVSCSEVRGMTRLHTHCGRCSQCLDRRYAALAAGMSEDDPVEMYAIDLMTGSRPREIDRIMAFDYTGHAAALARLTDGEILAKFGGELARVLEGFPEDPIDGIGASCLALVRRHGSAVEGVLQTAIRAESHLIARRALPPDSLLGVWLLNSAASPGGVVAVEALPAVIDRSSVKPSPAMASEERARRSPPTARSSLELVIDDGTREARVLDVTTLKGRGFELLRSLAEMRRGDRDVGLRFEDYRFAGARELAEELGLPDAEYLRRIVKRARDDVADCLGAFSEAPSDDVLIETGDRHRGYRLNPNVNLVAPGAD